MAMPASSGPDTDYLHAKALGPLRGPAAHMRHADDQQRLSVDRTVEGLLPTRAPVVVHDSRHPVVQHENGHERVLVGLLAMDAAAVGQDAAGRQPVEWHQMIDAGSVSVDPAKARRLPRQVLAVDAPTEQDIRGPHGARIDVAVIADLEP